MTRFLKKQTAVSQKFPNISWRDNDIVEREGQALEDSIQAFIKQSTLVNIDAKFRHTQAKLKLEELQKYRRKMETFEVYGNISNAQRFNSVPIFNPEIDRDELEKNQSNVEFHSKLLSDPTKAEPAQFFRASLIRTKPLVS